MGLFTMTFHCSISMLIIILSIVLISSASFTKDNKGIPILSPSMAEFRSAMISANKGLKAEMANEYSPISAFIADDVNHKPAIQTPLEINSDPMHVLSQNGKWFPANRNWLQTSKQVIQTLSIELTMQRNKREAEGTTGSDQSITSGATATITDASPKTSNETKKTLTSTQSDTSRITSTAADANRSSTTSDDTKVTQSNPLRTTTTIPANPRATSDGHEKTATHASSESRAPSSVPTTDTLSHSTTTSQTINDASQQNSGNEDALTRKSSNSKIFYIIVGVAILGCVCYVYRKQVITPIVRSGYIQRFKASSRDDEGYLLNRTENLPSYERL